MEQLAIFCVLWDSEYAQIKVSMLAILSVFSLERGELPSTYVCSKAREYILPVFTSSGAYKHLVEM